MTPHEVLIKADELIPTKKHWFGADQICTPGSLCLAWAIEKAADDYESELAAMEALANELPPSAHYSSWSNRWTIVRYNDHHTYKTCKAKLKLAIAATAPKSEAHS